MAGVPIQLVITSWLDDQNGPAKLTPLQRHSVALTESKNSKTSEVSPKQSQPEITTSSSNLIELLKPKWKPNAIIKMFYDEREKIIYRSNECRSLLEFTDSVLRDIIALNDSYLYVSPRTSQLHSECISIINERNDLKKSFDKINFTLSRQEELRSIYKRMPEIKNQILSVLNTVSQGYQSKIQLEGTTLDEYYGRFFIECRRIKDLASQLESCLLASMTDELSLHLEEIYTVYFDIREQLIEPLFTNNLRNLVSKADRNYCDLLRRTSTSLVRTLRNEIQLFNQIFSCPSSSQDTTGEGPQVEAYPIKRQAINSFLELLCKIFYEHLRPVIIHINHLETLTELYKLVVDTMRPEVAEEPYQNVMSILAEDVQERMVFRAEVFIQESVLDYKPSTGDLAYPEKLEIVIGGELKDFQSMWYPTVQRTVLALYYLNRVFDPITFKELAKDVVMACFRSLDVAQRLIDDRHGGTKIEATLFLSKHLAIIKDQLQSYGIERIQFLARSNSDPSASKFVEIDASDLESTLKLFQDNEFSAASSESLWSQLNETIVTGTKWTLRAARIKR